MIHPEKHFITRKCFVLLPQAIGTGTQVAFGKGRDASFARFESFANSNFIELFAVLYYRPVCGFL